MADYNVQMKQYNGTSFDNILPYASQALTLAGGGDATEIIAQARAGLSQIATGSYVGTGTYGSSNPVTVVLGFKPKIVLIWASCNVTKAKEYSYSAEYYRSIDAEPPTQLEADATIYNKTTYPTTIESSGDTIRSAVSYNDSTSPWIFSFLEGNDSMGILGYHDYRSDSGRYYPSYTTVDVVVEMNATDTGFNLFCRNYMYSPNYFSSSDAKNEVNDKRSVYYQNNVAGFTYRYIAFG